MTLTSLSITIYTSCLNYIQAKVMRNLNLGIEVHINFNVSPINMGVFSCVIAHSVDWLQR